jgi:hypothetical protein
VACAKKVQPKHNMRREISVCMHRFTPYTSFPTLLIRLPLISLHSATADSTIQVHSLRSCNTGTGVFAAAVGISQLAETGIYVCGRSNTIHGRETFV